MYTIKLKNRFNVTVYFALFSIEMIRTFAVNVGVGVTSTTTSVKTLIEYVTPTNCSVQNEILLNMIQYFQFIYTGLSNNF